PDAARRRSLAELAGCLTSPAEVARATDHLLTSFDLDELEAFVGELAQLEPGPASLLIEELLIRDDVAEPSRRTLRDVAAICGGRRGLARAPATRHPPSIWLGKHEDGRRILVVASRCPGRRSRARILCALLTTRAELL